ncbi:MAG: hypothetical protein AAF995_01660 [Planctomycetota bacterium]
MRTDPPESMVTRWLVLLGLLSVCVLISGCARARAAPAAASGQSGSDATDVVALVSGVPVARSAIEPGLIELGGAAVLEEVALDLLLADALREAAIVIGEEDVRRERTDLARSLVRAGAVEAGGARALERVFERRGLGPHRLERLLRRNAALRALVREGVEISEDELRLSYTLTHGERVRTRLITVEDRSLASRLDRELRTLSGADRLGRFDALAGEHSTHPSAAIGGRLEPMSTDDPGVPAALRSRAAQLAGRAAPPTLSEVFRLDDRYALLLVEGRTEPASAPPSFDAARAGLLEELRRRKERLAMDRLAARLLGEADIRAVDPTLGWSLDALDAAQRR